MKRYDRRETSGICNGRRKGDLVCDGWMHQAKNTLIILHGGPGFTHDYLTSLVPLLYERPVIWYDQLGCGNSQRRPDSSGYTLEYYTHELGAIRKELDLDDVHIPGQSWGTMLAVEYMLSRNPTGVRSLLLSAPCLPVSRWHADQRRYLSDLPADTREAICTSETEGRYDTNKYRDAMMIFFKKHVCRLEPWPLCLNISMEKRATDIYELMWDRVNFHNQDAQTI